MESINSVNVLAIDEERLVFRVMVGIDASPGQAAGARPGHYVFNLPPLTAFGNSNHYKQCVIRCDGINCQTAVGIEDGVWTALGLAGGRVGALEINLDIPSSGCLVNKQILPVDADDGNVQMGKFQQLVPVSLNLIGNTNGTIESIVGGNNVGTGAYAWQGEGLGDDILCANPFGSTVTMSFKRPDFDIPMYLVSAAAIAGADQGIYQAQFTITMVPNK